jgi:hypothetical protein
MKRILGYAMTVLAPLAGFFLSKYTGPAVGLSVGTALGSVGGRILHLEDAPDSKAP